MNNKDLNELNEKYHELIDLSENKLYNVGSVFFENKDGDNISNILTELTKVQIALVDSQQELIRNKKLKQHQYRILFKQKFNYKL